MKILDTKDIRTQNRLKILEIIHRNAPISRADIAVISSLNKATVSAIVKELLDLKLLKEDTIGDSTGGRKPIMLMPLYDVGYTLSIDLTTSKFDLALMTQDHQVVSRYSVPIISPTPHENIMNLCIQIQAILDTLPTSKYGLVSISIAIHGVVDLEGMIRHIHTLGWDNIDLIDTLEAYFNIPVHVNNAGNLCALAESIDYPQVSEMIVLTIDDAITAGIISHGQLIQGYLGFANVIGHHVIKYDGNPCICGKHGCLETYCTERVILNSINQFVSTSSMTDFITLVEQRNAHALEILETFIEHLAIGIGNLIYILNSELIVLNSKIFDAFPDCIEQLQNLLLLPITKTQLITRSRLGAMAPLLGANKVATEAFYKRILTF